MIPSEQRRRRWIAAWRQLKSRCSLNAYLAIQERAWHMRRHGTNSNYTNHGCRCRKCRRAHAEAEKLLRTRRLKGKSLRWSVRDFREFGRHGTRASYINHRCRCEACKAAQNSYNRAYYRKHRKNRKMSRKAGFKPRGWLKRASRSR